jgi:predicted MPP superfamily phosphohydrolase
MNKSRIRDFNSKHNANSLSIAVLSDLHAFDKTQYSEKNKYPSFLDMSIGEGRTNEQPISALKDLIESNKLKTDILLCAGDMGDKSNPSYIQYAWTKLQELKDILGASIIAATPGNHDHDSRSNYCKYDPRGALQTLSPKFPYENDIEFNKFWATNYLIISNNLFRLVIFNSSAFHGVANEREHGRISPYTLDNLGNDLGNTKEPPINILVCHHHPQKHEDLNLSDYEVMEGGQSLLKLLGSGKFGNWLVIHGHKHFPKLSYAQGFTGGPIVFSAGSLCAFLEPEIQAKARNQFYIIKFNLVDFNKYGFVGRFEAWDWSIGIGWMPASDNSGLPTSGGFGYRTQLDLLASKIAKFVNDSPKMEWTEITSSYPELLYLLPGDLTILEIHLNKHHSIKTIKSSEGLIMQIGKRK